MPARRVTATAIVVVLAGGALSACTGDDPPPDPAPSPTQSVTALVESVSPTATPSPTPPFDADTVLGEGTVTVDGDSASVAGDCDISRDFGQSDVVDVTAGDVDILLAVGNLGTANNEPRVRLELEAADVSGVRTIVLTTPARASTDGEVVRLRGPVEVLELVDRTELEFVDVAMLHVEAEVDGEGEHHDVSADVTCVISRP